MARKQELSMTEVIQVAFGHFYLGLEQQELSNLFGVNQGRVNEACQAVKAVAKDPREAYRKLKAAEEKPDE